MAVTDYDYKATRNQIIEQAFRIIGVLTPGDSLTGEQLSEGIATLNLLVKNLQAQHVFLWNIKSVTQVLTASDADYDLALDPPVLWIENALINDGSGDLPIRQISWREYQAIDDKTDTGKPYCYALNYASAPTLYTYYTPDSAATYTLKLLCVCRAKDWDLSTSDGDFPVRFQRPLIYSLAADLADLYQKPVAERSALANKAAFLMQEAIASDREREDYTFVKGAY